MPARALRTVSDLTTPSRTSANVQAAMMPTAYSAVVIPASLPLPRSRRVSLWVMGSPFIVRTGVRDIRGPRGRGGKGAVGRPRAAALAPSGVEQVGGEGDD